MNASTRPGRYNADIVGLRLVLSILVAAAVVSAQKRILYVTHSAGFVHGSIPFSERVLERESAATGKVEVISTQDLSFISADRLAEFDHASLLELGEQAASSDPIRASHLVRAALRADSKVGVKIAKIALKNDSYKAKELALKALIESAVKEVADFARVIRINLAQTRIGHNLLDTMWPWNGATGGPISAWACRARSTRDRYSCPSECSARGTRSGCTTPATPGRTGPTT